MLFVLVIFVAVKSLDDFVFSNFILFEQKKKHPLKWEAKAYIIESLRYFLLDCRQIISLKRMMRLLTFATIKFSKKKNIQNAHIPWIEIKLCYYNKIAVIWSRTHFVLIKLRAEKVSPNHHIISEINWMVSVVRCTSDGRTS